ncbi:hypothetical protein PFISCL1PPCAC_13478, partial [Pristionchus fissidentatus]
MEKEGDKMPSSEAMRSALIGPFSLILHYSGFDLRVSLCGRRNSRSRATAGTILFATIAILFLIRMVLVFTSFTPVLSYAWADSNIVIFMALHSFVSLVALARWTTKGVFDRIYAELRAIKRLHS